MNILLAVHHVIGRSPLSPSLAAIRSPGGLPDGLNAALFESHWAWWLAMAVIAGLLIYTGLNRNRRLTIGLGAGLLVATALLVLAALLVTTPDERLYAAHADLAAAAKQGDVERVLSYFEKSFTINALGIHADTSAADAKAELADRLKEYGIKENYIRQYKFTRRGAIAVTDITVMTQTTGGSIISSWEVSWDDVPGEGWRIAKARLTALNGQSVPDEPIR